MAKYFAVMADFKIVMIELFEASLTCFAYHLLTRHFYPNLLDDRVVIIGRLVIWKIFIHHF